MNPDREPRERNVFRFVFDVLATERQAQVLAGVLGEALCAAPDFHDGPCRIAWTSSTYETEDSAGEGGSLTADEVAAIRELLEPVPTWPQDEVDRSLGIEPA